jgi:hypothetical protein
MHSELATQSYSPLITLMSADYLLTARDLPGWPGSFPPIDYRELLSKSLNELAHGLYGEDRVARELGILNRIAEHHGMGEFFRQKVRDTRRYKSKKPFEGNGISPSLIFIDCSMYGVHNIFDAAYVAHYMNRLAFKVNISTIWDTLTKSVGYRLRSLRKGGTFPRESEWREAGTAPAEG